MTGFVKLMADSECRICYHTHPYAGRCGQLSHDPDQFGNDITSICICEQYVDLEAQSKIVVHVEVPLEGTNE